MTKLEIGTRVFISGDSAELWIKGYNVRVSTEGTIEAVPMHRAKKVLVCLASIDGDSNVWVYVRRSKIRVIEEGLPHVFLMPIGDWSEDGHRQCEYFKIRSNVPVEQVREAHYKIKDATGINIEEICSEYEENIMTPQEAQALNAIGFDTAKIIQNSKDMGGYVPNGIILTPEDMRDIWMFLLQKADPSIRLEAVQEEDIPMLPFYGYDEKDRHIDQVGYGLFID